MTTLQETRLALKKELNDLGLTGGIFWSSIQMFCFTISPKSPLFNTDAVVVNGVKNEISHDIARNKKTICFGIEHMNIARKEADFFGFKKETPVGGMNAGLIAAIKELHKTTFNK